MFKKSFLIKLLYALTIIIILVLLAFVNGGHETTKCKKLDIEIDFENGYKFISVEEIRDIVYSQVNSFTKRPLCEINLEKIESKLTKNPYIQKADVYSTIEGIVKVVVKQRKPIIRVINKDGESYYIDENAKLMPLCENYTARVPIVLGEIFTKYSSTLNLKTERKGYDSTYTARSVMFKIYKMASFINKSEFWNAQIDQISINDKLEFELIPKVGNHTIVFGDIDNMEEKFNKLLIFYKKGLNKVGWGKYSVVNLKYKNQVVCTKI